MSVAMLAGFAVRDSNPEPRTRWLRAFAVVGGSDGLARGCPDGCGLVCHGPSTADGAQLRLVEHEQLQASFIAQLLSFCCSICGHCVDRG